jgi:hypothetical protein
MPLFEFNYAKNVDFDGPVRRFQNKKTLEKIFNISLGFQKKALSLLLKRKYVYSSREIVNYVLA